MNAREIHVGIEASCWNNRRGYGRHARELVGALARVDGPCRYTYFTTVGTPLTEQPAAVHEVPAAGDRALAPRAGRARSSAAMLAMARELSRADVDVLLFPNLATYVPVLARTPKIVFIHDVIAESYPELTLPGAADRWRWRVKSWLGRRQACLVATVSEYSRDGLARTFGMSHESIPVIGEASSPPFGRIADARPTAALLQAGVRPGRRCAVYVGGFGPHKNLGRLLAAFATLAGRPSFADVDLLLVGEHHAEDFHTEAGRLAQVTRDLGLEERVRFTGYLEDRDLAMLLNLATVAVLPSLMEGFGLPAVEAAACGCPVVATRESPLPDLLNGGGLFIDPLDEAALAHAMGRLLADPELARETGAVAARRAAALSWDQEAGPLAELLERVARGAAISSSSGSVSQRSSTFRRIRSE